MRYLIQFRDKTTKRISEDEAKALMSSLGRGKAIIFRGAYLNPFYVDCIKPVTKDWFHSDFIRKELAREERMQLASGFQKAADIAENL